ncbi:hypothetical protein LCGC14_0728160 [marine sediment metagenome]|uniref:Uncharacterized protein n=1 Tax=marine sediment metagenome TaxID=412755 RepID=A0A0F9THJ4_9ZZZZ
MRTRETEKVLNVLTNPKTRLAFAVRLSIQHCQNKIDGKSEGEFPLCVMWGKDDYGLQNCVNDELCFCPVYDVTGDIWCTHAPAEAAKKLLRSSESGLTTRQRRHFRKLHWKQMKVLLEAIRDQKVGLYE